uniref:Uncharacterized protein LOC104218052 n=1 Tax=Nicotiana sylvestris TaxID=4096 RepID=A0A1U7VXP4_NICSY|nr:PREDICTED: uncharacterized protein LOC104218052 [Nicotiana sylvestris]
MRRKLTTRNSVCLQKQKRAKTSSDRNGYYLKWRDFYLEKIHNFPAVITFYHLQPKSNSRRIRRPNFAIFGGITQSASYSGYADDKSTQISRFSWLIMRCFLLQGILPREVERRMNHM